jgi:hypothetical protein
MSVSAQASAGGEAGLAAWIPLFQTALWVVAVLIMLVVFRRQIGLLRETIDKRLAGGASLKVGPFEFGELTDRVNAVENKVDDLSERVSRAFLVAMSRPMFGNLVRLSMGNFGHYQMHDGFERELRHLRDVGYVEIESIRGIPREGSDLSNYVTVTPEGRNFVALRQELDALRQGETESDA